MTITNDMEYQMTIDFLTVQFRCTREEAEEAMERTGGDDEAAGYILIGLG